jgi:ABC-type antimicrobial peptide transport system permease subunit
MVSQRLAQQLWPGQSAIGRQLVLWKGQSNDLAEIIGVVGNTRDWGLGREQSLAVYLPYYGANSSPYQLVLETRSDPAAVQRLLRKALDELDPSVPLAQVQSLASVVGASVSPRRFTMMLLAGFAAIALLLALAGIYGVLSYSVSRRTSEIGVRLAMGADPGGVLRLILRQGMQPVLFGIAAGCGAAIGLTRLMSSLLYGVAATDLVTYLGVALVLTAAGLASCYLPARRALQVDVVAALRQE